MNFYTNVFRCGNNILYRGVYKGRRIKKKVNFSPSLFVLSTNNHKTDWKTLNGEYLEIKTFDNINKASDFVKKYKDVDNIEIYGNQNYQYAFISEKFDDIIDWHKEHIFIDSIDIEVGSENGFPDPTVAEEEITAITVSRYKGHTISFGCGDYEIKGDEKYVKCSNERDLCLKFLSYWNYNCPDIITGWNIQGFDVPYLVNRFTRVLGIAKAKELSPWKIVNSRTKYQRLTGKEVIVYSIAGVAVLDYMDLYKTFAKNGKSQENYTLNNIANVEIGEEKISYDEYDNLHQLYKHNFQKFIEYNIKDTSLIFSLDNKLKLIDLAITLAYDSKSNYEDVFTQTVMWDSMIYDYLIKKNIVVPPKIIKNKSESFEGAYVKEPQTGMHNFVGSFDLNSLYPHLIMQYNISPEMLVEPEEYTSAMDDILSQHVNVDNLLEKKLDLTGLDGVTLTPNGQFFRTDKQGFLPEMLNTMYNDRKKYKKLMLQAEQEYEEATDDITKKELENKISRYMNLQLTKKVCLNSAYGAMGTQYFRFFDIRMALAVTQAGKLSIRWIEEKVNSYLNSVLKTEKDRIIASDTDSIYVNFSDLIEEKFGKEGFLKQNVNEIIKFLDDFCESDVQPVINDGYDELAKYVNAFDQKMQMKREALSDKGIWTAKKRYILNVYNNEGVQYNEPHLKIMGLEMIKSSTPLAVRDKMKETVKMIMTKSEQEVQKFINDFKTQFKSLPPEEVSFPRGVNGLTTYSHSVTIYRKGTPIHVKGSIFYNKFLKEFNIDKKYPEIHEGEKIKFTYLKEPNPLRIPVISFPGRLPVEFGIHNYIDYDTQFEKTFFSPIKVILDCIGWNAEKKSSLESFFV